METSYTDLEGTVAPKMSESCADPPFWAVLCIYLHFEYRRFQITKADYVRE